MPNNLTGQNISDTYQRLLQIEGGALTDGTGSAVIVPSASYAHTASIEITKEVSSSYAETASMASSNFTIQGDLTTSGNITGSQFIYAQRYYAGDRLALNYVNGEVALAYNSGEPIRIGKIANPVNLIGNLTASSNVGQNGNISASGDITGKSYLVGNRTVIDYDGIETFRIGASDPSLNRYRGLSFFEGNVTASNHISASGTITANNLEGTLTTQAQTNINALGTLGELEVLGNISTNSNLVGAAVLVDNQTALDTDDDSLTGKVFVNNNTTKIELGKHGTSQTVKLNGNVTASGNFVTTNITAAGNISASGYISASNLWLPGASKIFWADDQFILGQDNNITIDGDEFVRFKADDHVQFRDSSNNSTVSVNPNAGHITASGNISASGNVEGHAIMSKDNIAAEWNGVAMLLGTFGEPTTLRGTSTTLNNGNLILTDSTNGHITASGNITASQVKANEYKNQKVVLVQHSFAIARSSINGTYAGDGSEYLQGNTTWGVSDRAWVGNYTDTPDTGFDPTHIQNAYVIPYDVKNLRCDVMLETNKSALNGSESGSFFLFKKIFTGASYGNSTEPLEKIAMNFTLYDHANDAETAYPIFSVSSSGRLSGGNNNPISMSRGDLLFPFYKENVNSGETGHARGTFTITAEIV